MEEIISKQTRNLTQDKRERFSIRLALLFSFCLCFILALPVAAEAASLYFSPASGAYEVEKTFSASVYVSSADQAMNAVSGVISFPSDKLEVMSLSKGGSIFSLWVQEPAFSNSAGVINFEGIVLNPGFSGSGGKILTIKFKAKSAGQAGLHFSSGSILANDGAGTNILSSKGSANYQLSAITASPEKPTAEVSEQKSAATAGVPAIPQVLSSTHSDSNNWYSNKNPEFHWTLPAGVTGVGVYFSQSPTSNPGPLSDGLFASKSYENTEDGVWYFHLKFKNSYGWGPITHFKIQIDTKPPEPFTINFVDGKTVDQPRVKILFNTVDTLSGVDFYTIKINNNSLPPISLIDFVVHNPYTLPPQSPGSYLLGIVAFDKAGNTAAAGDKFIVRPSLPPQIIEFPQQLNIDENLEIKGESIYPKANIVLSIQKDNDEPNVYQIITDQDGKFVYISKEPLQNGAYKLWAYVTDEKGAQSNLSEKISINVRGSAIFRIGTWATSFLVVVVPLVALIIVLFIILWHGWHKFSLLRKRFRKEAREAESVLRRAFDLLKKNIQEQIKMLEKTRVKRHLTEEEEKIIIKFKKDLDASEKFIRKEIENIEKAVK